jgi:K+-sensing histidine kinase KdpD
MGMGLSICRSIIEDHNGRLWVEPNKPAGAVLQFSLPADSAPSAASGQQQPILRQPNLRRRFSSD